MPVRIGSALCHPAIEKTLLIKKQESLLSELQAKNSEIIFLNSNSKEIFNHLIFYVKLISIKSATF